MPAQPMNADNQINKLFVYGTLMRGEGLHTAIPADCIATVTAARVTGSLVDLGSFPGLLPPTRADQWVVGELFTMTNIHNVLPILDRIEGFDAETPEASLYRREIVTATDEQGVEHRTWVYVFNQPEHFQRVIPSGSWRQRKSRG